MTSPADKLRNAAAIIEQRDQYHGNWRVNMLNTSVFWQRYLGCPVTPTQVALLNCLQKVSRMCSGGEPNGDDYDDLIGWAAIAAALQDDEETLE
tara:strand:- start:863 stop:1144 length:282 start_codon:yes stop_codon:yes gene_type:complete